MSSPQAEKLNKLTYGGIAFIAAGVGMNFNIGYAAIAAGALLFFCAMVYILFVMPKPPSARP